MSTRDVRHGGLMRCCLQSIFDYAGPEVPGVTTIGCKFHEDQAEPQAKLAADGVWEWVGAEELRKRK